MTKLTKIFSTALLLTASLTATAQNNGANSPYSRYGFGLLRDGGSAFNKGMAGTAYGMRKGNELNTKNPASYAAIDSLTFLFDIGMSLQNGNFSTASGKKANARNTSVDYITAGYRLTKGLGMTIGMQPYSTIGYNSSTNVPSRNETTGTEFTRTDNYSGDGGTHHVFLGLGYAPIKQLSFGVNAGYLWGRLDHKIRHTFDDEHINTRQTLYETAIRTYKVDFGLQYTQLLGKKSALTLGLTYGLGHDIDRPAYKYEQVYTNGNVSYVDTARCAKAYGLPHTFGAGLTWSWYKGLRVGVDYTFEKWSNVSQPVVVNAGNGRTAYEAHKGYFSDLHRVSLGLEYTPNAESHRWRQRIRYRAGFAYTSPYVKFHTANGLTDGPQNFLASIGASLPIINMHNNRTFINLSAQYEHAKPKMPGMITENYIRFSIGLSFNERWFMKWKAE